MNFEHLLADRTKKMGASAIREIYASKPDLRAGRYSLSENCRYSPKVQKFLLTFNSCCWWAISNSTRISGRR